MDSEILQRARAYESRMEQEIREEERPGFHLTPRVGWMNDPNGFCRYGGRYHLFYQYHPYSTHWGPMHWGHAVSQDLLHWSYLPAALAPDADFDREGCFSGCALTLPDGRQELIYTGVSHGGIQTQCVAAGDGRDYKKEACNPVLSEKDLPPEVSPVDFRDPKAWQEADGTYRLLCAARSRDGGDTMFLLFESRDALHWRFVRTFLRCCLPARRIWRALQSTTAATETSACSGIMMRRLEPSFPGRISAWMPVSISMQSRQSLRRMGAGS